MLLTNYAIRFRPAVFVFIIVLVIVGSISYIILPREGSPDITIPYVFVTAIYEGTSPEEMEKLITNPLERKLKDVEHVEEIVSTSADSVASIVIKFTAGRDIDQALQRVKDRVDLARPDLPADLDEPIVQSMNFSSDTPIFYFTLSGDTPLDRLKKMADNLKDQIELVPGVREVEINGAREREIRVELDLPRLNAYNIPVGQVLQRIQQDNKTTSAGHLEVLGDKFQVRIPAEFSHAFEMRDMLLTTRNDSPVYLTDVAEIHDTYKDLASISRINGVNSISIGVKKRTGENSVALIDRVKQDVIGNFLFPEGVVLTEVYDESTYVRDMLQELENNISTGFFLVIAVLIIFMGGRNSLFVALAIPFSMLIAFIALHMIGLSMNMIVLFSLVLSVGMLVDNAIVIVENIYRLRSQGLTKIEAARQGASEVAWPVITSTMTTLAAFAPLLFWPDIMGQFMSFLPKTLIITLTASLFVAIVINPAVCSAFIKAPPPAKKLPEGEAPPAARHHPIVRAYERFLRAALRNRATVLFSGLAMLVFSAMLYGQFGKGVELFPDTDPRNARIELRFPQGTSIERTDEVLRGFEKILEEYEDIKFYMTNVGSTGGEIGGSAGTHAGNIHIEFRDIHERTGNSLELIGILRERIGQVPGADVRVEKQEEGPPREAPVSIEIMGDDFDTLALLAVDVRRRISQVAGLVDLQDDLEDALPELQFRVDRKKAALLGFSPQSVGLFLRASLFGLKASSFRTDEEEFDITVRLPLHQRDNFDMLDQMFVTSDAGQTVPLSTLGSVVYTGGRGAIRHKNQKRVVSINGNNENRGVDEIIAEIKELLAGMALPPAYHINFAGDTEEMQKSGQFLGRAFLIALGLILVILVIQFNSPVLPLIIVFSVVMSMVGVLWGLLISGQRFGIIMTGLGVISLAGIVVNNAIVLIDCIQQRKREGFSPKEAIVDAGRTRLRPVLLTAITTILGLLPMGIGYSLDIHTWPPTLISGAESSQWWAPMAWAVIFGLLFATILTLILVPVMFSTFDSIASRLRHRFGIRDD